MSPDLATPTVATVGAAVVVSTVLASLVGPLACVAALAVGLAVLGVTMWWVARGLRKWEQK